MEAANKTALTQSVARALSILSCFTQETPYLRVSDFAQKLDLTASSVSRLLSTMEAMGYVRKDEMSGAYMPGMELITLSGIALNNFEVRKQALPELHYLENTLNLSANLAIKQHDELFYLAHVDSRTAPKMYTMVGTTRPLYATAMGKVLLAFSSPDEIRRYLDNTRLEPLTNRTVTDGEELRLQLEETVARGYSTEYEELALGRTCIASPIRDHSGRVIAALSISGPLSQVRISERETALAQHVIETALRISEKLGFR